MAGKNILIVEDMPDWQDQLRSDLRRDGYAVTAVPTYGEALAELRRTEYQFVIVDLRLSPVDHTNRDGMTLLEDLKKLQIPSIVVTGHGNTELAQKAIKEYQVLDFMGKDTLDLQKLRREVKEAFRRIKGREKELRDLRYRFLMGEPVDFPESAIDWSLRETKGKQKE